MDPEDTRRNCPGGGRPHILQAERTLSAILRGVKLGRSNYPNEDRLSGIRHAFAALARLGSLFALQKVPRREGQAQVIRADMGRVKALSLTAERHFTVTITLLYSAANEPRSILRPRLLRNFLSPKAAYEL